MLENTRSVHENQWYSHMFAIRNLKCMQENKFIYNGMKKIKMCRNKQQNWC